MYIMFIRQNTIPGIQNRMFKTRNMKEKRESCIKYIPNISRVGVQREAKMTIALGGKFYDV